MKYLLRLLSAVTITLGVGLQVSFAPNAATYWLANGNTTGALQTVLSLGNQTNPVNPSFTISTSDDGTSHMKFYAPRWGSDISFTRADPAGTYNLMQIYGNNSAGSYLALFNTSNYASAIINSQGPSYFTGGNVGIGNTLPQNIVDIETNTGNDGLKIGFNGTGEVRLHPNSLGAGSYSPLTQMGDAGIFFGNNGSTYNFGFVIAPWSGNPGGMRITPAGNVLIGKGTQSNSAYLLDINGPTRANQVVVNTTGADFVFEPTYRLPSLQSIEKYIQTSHHLPGIAPAAQM